MNADDIPLIKLGEGLIGAVASSGDTYYREPAEEAQSIDIGAPHGLRAHEDQGPAGGSDYGL